jgi:nicotinate-nucleotide adenylyltransferase
MVGRVIVATADMSEIRGDRIGVLGGTFDPVHNGHLAVAGHVLNMFRLDSLLFIPAARPPHKGHIETTPFFDRLKMLELAVRVNDRFLVSNLEAQREGPSYSIDTLIGLKNIVTDTAQLFFIIGTDAFAELNTWKKYRELTDHANLLIIDRPDYPLAMVSGMIKQLGDYSFDPGLACWTSPEHPGSIYSLAIPPIDISSTDIRARIAKGQVLADLVPSSVDRYIAENCLYQDLEAEKGL